VSRYLAVVDRDTGYALGALPSELARYRRKLGKRVVGEFGTRKEAEDMARDMAIIAAAAVRCGLVKSARRSQ
jgi:hypothetical protein